MGIVLLSLPGTVSVAAGGYPRLSGDVYIGASSGPYIESTLDIDGTVSTMARPRGSVQVVGWKITVGGTEIPPHKIAGPVTVTRTREGFSTWSFSVPIHSDFLARYSEAPTGSPFAYSGAPPGLSAVNIYGLYITSTGLHSIPLITNGIVTAHTRQAGPPDVDVLNGTDAGGRYDRAKVTRVIPPGHGLTVAGIGRRLLTDAGASASTIALQGSTHRYKEIQIIDGDAFSLLREINDAENRLLYADADGKWINPVRVTVQENPSPRIAWVLSEVDVMAGNGVAQSSAADVATSVTLTGTRQVTRDACGRRTKETLTETFAYYTIKEASFSQGTTGTLTATSYGGGVEAFQIVSRVRVLQEWACDTLSSERVITEGWYNPVAARYTYDLDGTYNATGYHPCFIYEADALEDDGYQGRRWGVERWCTLSDIRTEHIYDARGFETQTIVREAGWHLLRGAVKARTIAGAQGWSEAWESLDFLEAKILANGEGCGLGAYANAWYGELFYTAARNSTPGNVDGGIDAIYSNVVPPISSGIPLDALAFGDEYQPSALFADLATKVTQREIDDLGFTRAERTTEYGFGLKGGGDYLYNGGDESSEDSEVLTRLGAVEVTYQEQDGEGTHVKVTSRFDGDGRLVESTTEAGDGHLPAAEQSLDIVPDAAIYDNADEESFAKAASRFESQTIKVKVEAPSLLATHEQNDVKMAHNWVESTDELEAVAVRLLKEGAALRVNFTLAGANFLLRENTRVHLRLKRIGLDHDVDIETVTHSGGMPGSAPIITTATGLIPVL